MRLILFMVDSFPVVLSSEITSLPNPITNSFQQLRMPPHYSNPPTNRYIPAAKRREREEKKLYKYVTRHVFVIGLRKAHTYTPEKFMFSCTFE